MSISVRNEKVSIRHAVIADAENLITLRKRLFKQTQYMLFEDEEYNPSVESEIRFIEHFAQSLNSTVLLALKSQQLIVFMHSMYGISR